MELLVIISSKFLDILPMYLRKICGDLDDEKMLKKDDSLNTAINFSILVEKFFI